MKNSIAQIVVALAVDGPFDYEVPSHLQNQIKIGQRVWISFANRKRVGYVVNLASESDFKELKSIISIIDPTPLVNASQMHVANQMASKCGCSLGEAIEIQFPRLIRQGKNKEGMRNQLSISKRKATTKVIIDAQMQDCWDEIGKAIKQTLSNKQQVLILVPEDCVYAQVQNHLQKYLTNANVLTYQKHTPAQDLPRWQELQSGKVDVYLGVRSCVFAPLPNLGLAVVLDEEHDGYKEEQSPFFHVRNVIRYRQDVENFDLVFASLAPSLECVSSSGAVNQIMPVNRPLQTKVLDLTNYDEIKRFLFCPPAREHILAQINEGLPVVAFVFSVNLVPHVKEWLKKFFPEARIGMYQKASKDLPKRYDILIATQALFRKRYAISFPTIIVVDIDAALHRLDYKSAQRGFSYVRRLQSMAQDHLIIQTEHIDHPCLQALQDNNIDTFYKQELQVRQDLEYPPYYHFILVIVRNMSEEIANQQAQSLYDTIEQSNFDDLECSEAHEDIIPVLRNKYRFAIRIKTKQLEQTLKNLKQAIRETKKKKGSVITINVNP